MPVLVTLTGTWVAPNGAARTGKVTARRFDENRVAGSVWGGTSTRPLVAGALPTTGDGRLRVTAPDSGAWSYDITEALDDVAAATYRITVTASDATNGIDLSTRPLDA